MEQTPADPDAPLYNSRIINTRLEYLQQFHADIDIACVAHPDCIHRGDQSRPYLFKPLVMNKLARTVRQVLDGE